METLRKAICVLKHAEDELASEGFILTWKVKVKPDKGFFKKLINSYIKGENVPSPDARLKSVQMSSWEPKEFLPEKKIHAPANKKEKNVLHPEAAETAEAEVKPEVLPAETQELNQEPAEMVDEVQPVTALDIKSAASYLGVSVASIYDLIKRGKIIAHGKMGERWYKIEDLDRYAEEREKRRAAKKALEKGDEE